MATTVTKNTAIVKVTRISNNGNPIATRIYDGSSFAPIQRIKDYEYDFCHVPDAKVGDNVFVGLSNSGGVIHANVIDIDAISYDVYSEVVSFEEATGCTVVNDAIHLERLRRAVEDGFQPDDQQTEKPKKRQSRNHDNHKSGVTSYTPQKRGACQSDALNDFDGLEHSGRKNSLLNGKL